MKKRLCGAELWADVNPSQKKTLPSCVVEVEGCPWLEDLHLRWRGRRTR